MNQKYPVSNLRKRVFLWADKRIDYLNSENLF